MAAGTEADRGQRKDVARSSILGLGCPAELPRATWTQTATVSFFPRACLHTETSNETYKVMSPRQASPR